MTEMFVTIVTIRKNEEKEENKRRRRKKGGPAYRVYERHIKSIVSECS
jgi:hypothetical protein